MSALAWRLAAIAIAGQALAYLVTIALARTLTLEEFDAYVVAAAVFVMMVGVASRGADRAALLVLPPILDRADAATAGAYLRFATRRTVAGAFAIGFIAAAGVSVTPLIASPLGPALLVACLALPCAALVHLQLEVLTAAGRETVALAVFRLLVPSMTLSAIALTALSPIGLSAPIAIGTWGIAWAGAALVFAQMVQTSLPQGVSITPAADLRADWSRTARLFFHHRVMMVVMAQASLLMLDALNSSPSATGAYAAALATSGFMVTALTATNRVYARRMALLAPRNDRLAVEQLSVSRLRWLLPVLAVYITLVLLFADDIIGIFRPAFVAEGSGALKILACATSLTLIFALAPTFLKFTRQQRPTLLTAAVANVVQFALLLLLIPRYGASGAAAAYGISLIGLYARYAILARRSVSAR